MTPGSKFSIPWEATVTAQVTESATHKRDLDNEGLPTVMVPIPSHCEHLGDESVDRFMYFLFSNKYKIRWDQRNGVTG